MSSRQHVLHDWLHQWHALVPTMRRPRVAPLALLSLGIIWAGTVSLPRVASALSLPVRNTRTERRLRRWLRNRQVRVTALWRPFIRAALARCAGQQLILSLDPTDIDDRARIYYLGVVVHRRVVPLAWRLLPFQTPWRRDETRYLARLFRRAARWLPPGCPVTLVADRTFGHARVIRRCQSLGGHYVLRLSADAKQGPVLPDGCPVWALVPGEGKRWYGSVRLFKRHGGIDVQRSICWRRGARHGCASVTCLQDRSGCVFIGSVRTPRRCTRTVSRVGGTSRPRASPSGTG